MRGMSWTLALLLAVALVPACGKKEPAEPRGPRAGRGEEVPGPEHGRDREREEDRERERPEETEEPGAGTFPAVRDARVFGHRSEQKLNGGASSRLRARSLTSDAPELIVMDFETGAINDFLEERPGKKVSATLVLAVRQVQNGPGKLQVATLNAQSEWMEGSKSQQPAQDGEITYLGPRFHPMADGKHDPWMRADGSPAADLKDLVWDASLGKARGVANSAAPSLENTPDVKQADQASLVKIVLDEAVLKDLLENDANRGLVLFTTDGAILDFFSREQGQEHARPRLELSMKE